MEDGPKPRNPPPKVKRANAPSAPADSSDDTYVDQDYESPIRRGRYHANRQSGSPPMTPTYSATRQVKVPIVDAEPETTIGAAVKMKGELSFERLLRIEGEFEGKLNSKGSLVIGSRGALFGNVDNMKEVFIAGGRIIGNINVEKISVRDKGQIFGNITAKTIKIEPECIVVGQLNVNPQAPEKINDKGEIVKVDVSHGTSQSS
ncbi:polymer-forming cytoskeletal [Plasmopara halstedii]|uniref:Polymer-forming cytoskeletal n=1 Tax=Plasmopara halstedii TaxID=4781 RepID=A0A0P1ACS9_PLAHL|nr:polymer-forming cytoskeletal [Plasmopara halstedii]CEG38266.1 polymer-forming cytoskeletal [Plasmopara halstedii]|eukprot:XP_024574635.1 polymer-forming cytoskeletal [Plasmopara halstedii]